MISLIRMKSGTAVRTNSDVVAQAVLDIAGKAAKPPVTISPSIVVPAREKATGTPIRIRSSRTARKVKPRIMRRPLWRSAAR